MELQGVGAFQVAYYIDKASRSSQVLLQEPIVKDEDTQFNEDDSQFSYSALCATLNALILVPEPYDPNNTIALPEMLNIGIE
ncbi:hypothetical protein IWW56_001335 [Coemansia sp. RSA 2131]|nr:hypothetical protein IWW56_001335 [Coemansia sp. RSA 2131]KAJ2659698.1 hypothetical protein IW148_004118 [Coemansia sp. RSA 1199]